MGFPGQVIIPAAGDSRQLYRVLLGGYNTRDDAERAKARLVETEGQKASEYFITRR